LNLEILAKAVGDETEPDKLSIPPVARPLSDFVVPHSEDPDELLKYRFLCRGGGLLLVGPTGAGKSALAMQAMILWALGREAFGIKPARSLKSLLVQAENDDGDLAEMRDGIARGLQLSDDERSMVGQTIMVVREDVRFGLAFGEYVLKPLLEQHRPDLLWIDPVLSYLGGEANSQKDVGGFLRNMLNPLLREFACGCVILHHTNKPPVGREKPDWQGGDFAYLGSGSIEWAGWARGVMALRTLGSHSVFELRAGKRGARLRWKDEDGETPVFAKLIAHSKEQGVICWRDALEEDLPPKAVPRKEFTKEDVMPHVPVNEPITKEALKRICHGAGAATNKINGLIAELIDEGKLFEWRRFRKGTNPLKLIARFQQPEEELPLQ
jgi:hypothetical protein